MKMSDPYVQRPAAATPTTSRPRDVYYDVDATTVVTPKDRVRWASVLAGLVTALASMIIFAVLGIALGFAAFDPGEPNRYLGLGTSIYAIVTGLLSFAFAGFVAARTAAVTGGDNGFLHGMMVWMVAIVFIVNMLGMGLGALLGTAANVAGEAAANLVDDAAVAVGVDAAGQATVGVDTNAAGTGADTVVNVPAPQVTQQQAEQAADTISNTAWMTLLAMGLTAFASIIGGVLGARRDEDRTAVVRTTT
jgi:hypothetical protein